MPRQHQGKPLPQANKPSIDTAPPCHGTDAKGTGPLAAALKAKPADLTLIYKRAKGVFPFMMVVNTIEEGTPLKAHGGGEMPIWGKAFEDDARGRILDIVLYLNSIQAR